jgi:hypothetical protein
MIARRALEVFWETHEPGTLEVTTATMNAMVRSGHDSPGHWPDQHRCETSPDGCL